MIDQHNYYLAIYISYAINQPKKFPKKPFLYDDKKEGPMTPEEMERKMKLNTKILKGKIDGD